MSHSPPKQLCFPPVAGQTIRADFEGGALSSDLGALLLRGVDRQIGLTARLAAAIRDKRHQSYIDHPLRDLLAQRIYQIASGYADANDANPHGGACPYTRGRLPALSASIGTRAPPLYAAPACPARRGALRAPPLAGPPVPLSYPHGSTSALGGTPAGARSLPRPAYRALDGDGPRPREGGAVGTRMPTRLRMPWRGETMRRMLRHPLPAQPTPRGLGLDDCALRPGRVSSTILVALEQPRPVEFLPERTAETVATWLQEHQVSKSWPATGPRTTPEAQQRGRRWPRRWPIVCTYSVTSARYSRTHLG